jgi:HEAT repeat protein
MKALDDHQWDKAIEGFTEVANENGSHSDGALYWKAYAENKLGRCDEALATIAALQKQYPASRWLSDAKALELEVRQASGQPVKPESETDEDLKLLAINSLMQSDQDRAVPLLEKILQGSHLPKLKERALFVLSQSNSPRAREVLAQIARGKANPDLQMKALRYFGITRTPENQQILADVYSSSNDLNVKRAILQSFMVGGARDRLLSAAKEEKTPELRAEAIRQLGAMGAQAELWQLYQSEPSVEIKAQIVNSLFIGGNADRLAELARTEKEPRLRREAIHRLGLIRRDGTGDTLVSIYNSETDPNLRKEVVNSLFLQSNAKALVDLARKEADPTLKKEIVHRLSTMKSKEATDYIMELLNK